MKVVPLSIKATDWGLSPFSIGTNSIFPLNHSDASSTISSCLYAVYLVSVKSEASDFRAFSSSARSSILKKRYGRATGFSSGVFSARRDSNRLRSSWSGSKKSVVFSFSRNGLGVYLIAGYFYLECVIVITYQIGAGVDYRVIATVGQYIEGV